MHPIRKEKMQVSILLFMQNVTINMDNDIRIDDINDLIINFWGTLKLIFRCRCQNKNTFIINSLITVATAAPLKLNIGIRHILSVMLAAAPIKFEIILLLS